MRLFNTFSSSLRALGRTLTFGVAREDGQTLAEYALIISAIAVTTIVTAIILLRDPIVNAFNSASSCLTSC